MYILPFSVQCTVQCACMYYLPVYSVCHSTRLCTGTSRWSTSREPNTARRTRAPSTAVRTSLTRTRTRRPRTNRALRSPGCSALEYNSYLSICLSIYLSIYLSLYHLSIFLSIYLSIYLFIYKSILIKLSHTQTKSSFAL